MSAIGTINAINSQTLQYAPAVLAGIQAAEAIAPTASGSSKQAAVVQSVLTGIDVGSGALESSPNPTVSAVAQMVNLFVAIFNSLGIFKKSAAQSAGAGQ